MLLSCIVHVNVSCKLINIIEQPHAFRALGMSSKNKMTMENSIPDTWFGK